MTVKKIFVGSDSGPVSNPDGLKNQLEGGALQGMSRTLGEEVTWDDQKVTSIDWRTLPQLAAGIRFSVGGSRNCFNSSETKRLQRGAGETTVTIIGAAIGNAIFDATGARVRQIPFTPERVKAAALAHAT